MLKPGVAGTTLILLFGALGYWLFPRAEGIAAGVTLATALVVLWYTLETHEMRKQMVEQREAAIRPLLLLQVGRGLETVVAGTELRVDILVLRNIGNGPALGATVADLTITKGHDLAYNVRCQPVPCIEAGTEARLQFDLLSPAGKKLADSSFYRAVQNPEDEYRCRVGCSYQDVNGKGHGSLFELRRGGFRLAPRGGSRDY